MQDQLHQHILSLFYQNINQIILEQKEKNFEKINV